MISESNTATAQYFKIISLLWADLIELYFLKNGINFNARLDDLRDKILGTKLRCRLEYNQDYFDFLQHRFLFSDQALQSLSFKHVLSVILSRGNQNY